jgi:hippurate hydrolase
LRSAKLCVASSLFALLLSVAPPSAAGELEEQVAAEVGSLMEIFKHLHTYPELSYQEKESAALVARELRKLGFEVTEEVGDYGVEGRTSYGVVGVMRNGPGPTVMVRTDLDALPIEEKTGLAYASRATGVSDSGGEVLVMQACGHDLHMTTFVGTARMLARIKDQWSGTLVMIGQPAEERGAGAKAMLDDGLFERFPKPEYALAFHANAELPAGTVGMLSGYALANVDSVDITIRGRGGHGAYPHKTKDPVTLAAQVIINLQPIVSRQVSPFDPAVVTVGSIHGGTKHNIIPDEVHLQLTVRSYKPEVRDHLLTSIRKVAEETARAAGFPEELLPVVELVEEEYTPSTYNDPQLVERLAGVAASTLGEDRVTWVEPVMAGEDFARYGLEGEIPIAIMWLGAVEPAKVEDYARRGEQLPGLHSAGFTVFPEPAIRTGVTAMTAAVLDLMRP